MIAAGAVLGREEGRGNINVRDHILIVIFLRSLRVMRVFSFLECYFGFWFYRSMIRLRWLSLRF